MATCYRHPDRETNVACSMCARPICPDCMTATPVGMRCPECSQQRTRVAQGPAASLAGPPWMTYTLIGMSVLGFVISVAAGSSAAFDAGGSVVTDYGLFGPAVDSGELYRLVTSGFLHAGLIHLALNMLVLFILGRMLEPGIGPWRLAGIYFVSLLGGAFGALLLDPREITVGASGAIFGLMAAAFVIARRRGMSELANEIGVLVGINLLFTFTIPNISIGGHLGGLAAGGLAALAVTAGERQEGNQGMPIEIGGLVLVGIAAALGSVAVAGG